MIDTGALFDWAPAPMLVVAPDSPRFTIVEVNQAYCDATMRTRAGLVGRGLFDVMPDNPEEAGATGVANLRASIARAIATRRPDRMAVQKYDIPHPDGGFEERWWEPVNAPVLSDDGSVQAIVHHVVDVTGRIGAEDRERVGETRYRMLFDAIDEGFCVLEFIDGPLGPLSDYVHVEANPAYTANAGIPDIVGKRLREVVLPEEADSWVARFRSVLQTGESIRFDQELVATGRHLELAAFRVGTLQDRQVAVLFQDVTAKKRDERELRELNETLEARVVARTRERNLFATMFESTEMVVTALAPDFTLLAGNKAFLDTFEALYGARPSPGDDVLAAVTGGPEEVEKVRGVWSRVFAGEEYDTIEEFGDVARERSFFELKYRTLRDDDGSVIGAYQFVSDVSQRMRAQAELANAQEALRQAQKMEAMGQLTGGVAHDFNNLLTPIVGSLDMLQRRGIGNEREQRLIDGAMQSAERAKTLVQRLLAFARRQPLQATAIELPVLIDGMAELIGSTLGPSIEVRVELDAGLPPVRADANQLEMALLNLAVNARDAMPDGGLLTLSARRESVRPVGRPGLARGHYVRLAVRDTGAGMDADTLARAVEPFFSTKGIGKGTGLGLSMVHGLAAQLGGELTIDSRLGAGTTVELWLPISAETAGRDAISSATSLIATTRGRALLVDDEKLVRLSTADMLSDLGFQVLEAASAEEALEFMRDGVAVDVLVTDHLMPGICGSELASRAQALQPGLPVLLASGYAEAEGVAADLPRLTKPFRASELAASIEDLQRIQSSSIK